MRRCGALRNAPARRRRDQRAELVLQVFQRRAARVLGEAHGPVRAGSARRIAAELDEVPRRHPPLRREDGARPRAHMVEEVVVQPLRRELAARARIAARADPASRRMPALRRGRRVDQLMHADAIDGQQAAPLAAVPGGQREIAADPCQRALALALQRPRQLSRVGAARRCRRAQASGARPRPAARRRPPPVCPAAPRCRTPPGRRLARLVSNSASAAVGRAGRQHALQARQRVSRRAGHRTSRTVLSCSVTLSGVRAGAMPLCGCVVTALSRRAAAASPASPARPR